MQIIRAPQPYAGMNIGGVTGLTTAQQTALKALGAVEDRGPNSELAGTKTSLGLSVRSGRHWS